MFIKRLAGTAWGVWDDDRAAVIDTAKRSQRDKLFKEIKKAGMKVDYILLTHTHYDHMGSAEALRQKNRSKGRRGCRGSGLH